MVRRPLLTALLAALAVALPVAAEDPAECPPTDLACGPAEATTAVCDFWEPCPDPTGPAEEVAVSSRFLVGAEGAGCSPGEINLPDGNQPITETLILDPEGCIRKAVRGVLDKILLLNAWESTIVHDPVSIVSWL